MEQNPEGTKWPVELVEHLFLRADERIADRMKYDQLKQKLLDETRARLQGTGIHRYPTTPTIRNINSAIENDLENFVYDLLEEENPQALGELLLTLPDQKTVFTAVLTLLHKELFKEVLDTLRSEVEIVPPENLARRGRTRQI